MMMSRISAQKNIWKTDGYITYRRFWLDLYLKEFSHEMRGTVLDLGGKRENKRGSFQPPEHEAQAWWYLNLDWVTKPNMFADVTETPLKNASIDCILCTEVLEHLKDPQACVDEIHRLLRDDGLVFASTPFFYPVHADPYDFQRFTEDGLRHLFREFKSVEVYRMGGYFGVLGLMCELGIPGEEGKTFISKFTRWALKWLSRWLCSLDLSLYGQENTNRQKFTTGYFVKAIR
ncbi:MAG TPA: class I SAM-dependent methyltransferase [Anaerolineales bacterium]|nr:class I SAM-dependent methyltransferase [Anaerolineales bacterium]